MADWNGSTVTGLRQITKGSDYPIRPNPIQMSAGAHFSEVANTIIFGSTRTPYGNSQLFEVPVSADRVPVSSDNRHPDSSNMANDYVPEPLADGRIVITSDREEFDGFNPCGFYYEIQEYIAFIDINSAHTITIEAAGVADPPSSNVRIHLDAHRYGQVLREQDEGTTYSGTWTTRTSPNASMGTYAVATGDAGEYVDIFVPSGNVAISLYFGRTPMSGIARIYIDGELDGELNLYTEFMTVSNDLDLVILDGTSQTNLTANDYADEMLLIGDEVSWFCGLSPNLSLCTYLPKYFTKEQLCWMMNSQDYLPEYYPARCLYATAYEALDDYMSGPNSLRPHNQGYWTDILNSLCDPGSAQDLLVLPTPVTYFIENDAPNVPAEGYAYVDGDMVSISIDHASDPNGDAVTYDFLLSFENEPMILAARDVLLPEAVLYDLIPGGYSWQVVCKDCRGGLAYTDVWNFTVPSVCDYFPGDVNHNGIPLELGDAIGMIGMYRGYSVPPYECACPPHGDNFTPTADPNGNCVALELGDVVTIIGAYRGSINASGCVDCPGSLRLVPGDKERLPVIPSLKMRIKDRQESGF